MALIGTLPPAATCLQARRRGPGSMPELLITAGPGTTASVIPATITFTPAISINSLAIN